MLTGSQIERVREPIASRLRTWTNMTTGPIAKLDNNHTVTAPTRAEQDLPTQAAAEEPVPAELRKAGAGRLR